MTLPRGSPLHIRGEVFIAGERPCNAHCGHECECITIARREGKPAKPSPGCVWCRGLGCELGRPIPWAYKPGTTITTLTREIVKACVSADPVTRLLALACATRAELAKLTEDGTDARHRLLKYRSYGIALRELGAGSAEQARLTGKGEKWIIAAIRAAMNDVRSARRTGTVEDKRNAIRAFTDAMQKERR